MVIHIGADHRGFELKEKIKAFLKEKAYEVFDQGAAVKEEGDDYTDFAAKVAEAVSKDFQNAVGILICGSGVGVEVAANKVMRIRAGLGFAPDQVYAARHDDHINILAIASDHTDEESAKRLTTIFLETPPGTDEKYLRRIAKIDWLETKK